MVITANKPKKLPPKLVKKLIFAPVILVLMALCLYFIFSLFFPTRTPTNERFTERLEMAQNSLIVSDGINEVVKAYEPISEQLNAQDYDTLLGIDNGENTQEITEHYAGAIAAVKSINRAVENHAQMVAEEGGLVTVNDLHRVDTLPVESDEHRRVILKNMGTTLDDFEQAKIAIAKNAQKADEFLKQQDLIKPLVSFDTPIIKQDEVN